MGMRTVWIYIDPEFLPGHLNHLRVFATEEAARRWLGEYDPDGSVQAYPVDD
jgi:hypothetical protein